MFNLILATPQQLEQFIESSVKKALQERPEKPAEDQKETLNHSEAAKYLGIAKQTLYGYTSKRLIPFIKIGRKRILFRKSDLEAWLMDAKKPSISELNNLLNKR